MTKVAGSARLTVLYDGDCAFCTHWALVLRTLDVSHRLRLVPLQNAAIHLPGAPNEQDLMAAMHVVDASGHWERGGAAWVRIARTVPLLR